MMQQILTRLNQVPSGYMSQSAQQMLQTSLASPGYMTQPVQEKEDTVMAPPSTLKRQYEQVSIEGHDDSRDGIDPGMDKNMDTEFKIKITLPGVEMHSEDLIGLDTGNA
jgi:hypothetical protein